MVGDSFAWQCSQSQPSSDFSETVPYIISWELYPANNTVPGTSGQRKQTMMVNHEFILKI